MSLYKYEFKKLFKGKLCIILLILLAGLNLLFGIITAKQEARENDYSERFVRETENIIYNAKMNYISIEDKNSQNAQYQLEIIQRYSELQSLDVNSEVYGYDKILSSPLAFISALFFGIISAIMLTYQEHSSDLVLSSFRNSRIKICLCKIALIFTVSFAGIFVFLGLHTIGTAIGNGIGFSGASEYVQCIPAYIHCPDKITVMQAVLLRFLFVFVTVFVLSMIVFVFAIITRKAIWALLFTVLFMGGDYLLTNINSANIFSIFYQLNIRNFITDNWLLKYNGKQIFIFLSQIELFCWVAGLLCAVLIPFAVWRFRYTKVIQSSKSRRNSSASRKQSPKSFLYYELKKIFSVKVLVAVVVLLAANLIALNSTVQTEGRDLERIYRYYVDQMSDMQYEEQVQFSAETKANLRQLISDAKEIREKFINGEETHENYMEAQQRAGAAELELDVMQIIDRQLNSIGELNEKGVQAKLIYSTGWKKLMQNGSNLFLLFAIMMLVVPYVTFEKESGISAVLPGIFKGNKSARRKFLLVKFLLALFSSIIIAVMFYSGELLLINSKYMLSNWTAYAAGADILFRNIQLKIIQALFLRLLFSILGSTIIILLAEVLTVFLKKSVFVIFSMMVIELPIYIISAITSSAVCSISSYFGFDLLYAPYSTVIIETALLILLPILVLGFRKRQRQIVKTP